MAISGWLVLLAALGLPVVAVLPGWTGVGVWAAGLLALVVLDVVLAASPRTVAVTRDVPGRVRLGELATSELTLTNLGPRRLRALVRDAWQPSAGAEHNRHAVDVPPAERRRVRTGLRPTRRGDRLADAVTVRSWGPLRLAARQASLPVPGRLRVLPPFRSRRHLPSRLARLRELDGRASVQVRGHGTEFDSLRDYVIGDDVRSIDWRATARRQQVVVRTWRPERDRRVLVVLDTSRTSAARIGDEPRLDAAMDAALLLSALASRAGDRVDLVAVDRRVRAHVEGVRGSRLLGALVEAMAPLEPALLEADWPLVVGEVQRRMTQHGLVVLLTPLEAAAVEEGLLPVVHHLTGRHTVLLGSVTDPVLHEMASRRGDVDAVFDAAAAERTALDRVAVTGALERAGVEVVEGSPAELPPRLADAYLALKAAGRL